MSDDLLRARQAIVEPTCACRVRRTGNLGPIFPSVTVCRFPRTYFETYFCEPGLLAVFGGPILDLFCFQVRVRKPILRANFGLLRINFGQLRIRMFSSNLTPG